MRCRRGETGFPRGSGASDNWKNDRESFQSRRGGGGGGVPRGAGNLFGARRRPGEYGDDGV